MVRRERTPVQRAMLVPELHERARKAHTWRAEIQDIHPVHSIFDRILALLSSAGVIPVVHEHVAVRTIAEAHIWAPHLVENLVKTIAFEIEPGPRIVLAAVAWGAQVDYKQLSALLACNRRALRLMPAERVEAELGFEVGGLGPFALRADMEVVVDSALLAQPWLRCGAGLRTRTLELKVDEVVRVSRARVATIAKRAD